jgi:hypothetical protein
MTLNTRKKIDKIIPRVASVIIVELRPTGMISSLYSIYAESLGINPSEGRLSFISIIFVFVLITDLL